MESDDEAPFSLRGLKGAFSFLVSWGPLPNQ